jgi:hypothetical protein
VKCIGHMIQPVFLMFICSTWLWEQTLSTRPAEPTLQPSNSVIVQARTPLRVAQDPVRIRKLGQPAGPWPHPTRAWLLAVARSPSARRRFWLRPPDLYSLWRSQRHTVTCPVTRERQWVRSGRCLRLASTNSSNSMCTCRRGEKLYQNRPIKPFNFHGGERFKCGASDSDLDKIFMTGLDGTPHAVIRGQCEARGGMGIGVLSAQSPAHENQGEGDREAARPEADQS